MSGRLLQSGTFQHRIRTISNSRSPSPPTVRKDRTGVAGARFSAIEVIRIALLLLNLDVFGYQRWRVAAGLLDPSRLPAIFSCFCLIAV